MSSLINRIQRAFLGSAGPEKVRALLAELAIPTGGSGGSIREVRRGLLRPISDEAILRDALANMGIAGGGGGGDRALSNMRNAVLHNLVDSETAFVESANELLEPDDMGGGGAPAWVPANARIHIDFLGGTPQGRAWVEGTGTVAITSMIGSDPNSNNFGGSLYDPSYLVADGYKHFDGKAVALLGAAKTLVLAAATVVTRYKQVDATPNRVLGPVLLGSTDGNEAVYVEVRANSTRVARIDSFTGAGFAQTANLVTVAIGAVNQTAVTVTATRMDCAMNGGTAITMVLDGRPAGNPMTYAVVFSNPQTAVQLITLYDPLPDTTGLSDLSEV